MIDAYKRKVCFKREILLVEINELNPRNNPEKWKEDIKDVLVSKGIVMPENYNEIPFGAVEYHSSNNYILKCRNWLRLEMENVCLRSIKVLTYHFCGKVIKNILGMLFGFTCLNVYQIT